MTQDELSQFHSDINHKGLIQDSTITKIYNHYRIEGHIDSSNYYLRRIAEVSKELNLKAPETKAYNYLGISFVSTENIDSASYYLNLVLSMTDDTDDEDLMRNRAEAFMFLGALYSEKRLGDTEAELFFQKGAELSKQIKFTRVYILCTSTIIYKNFERKNFTEIPRVINECLEYLNSIDQYDERFKWDLNRFRAIYLAETGTTEAEKKEGVRLILDSYEGAKRSNNVDFKALYLMTAITRFGDDIPRESLLEMIEESINEVGNVFKGSRRGGLLYNYGKVLMLNEQYGEAISVLKESQGHLKDSYHLINYSAATSLLIEAYNETNQSEKIYPQFKNYTIFQDSFITYAYDDKLLDLEEKYQNQKIEFENEKLISENDAISTRYYLSLIIGTLFLIGMVASYYFFRRLKKNKLELEKLHADKSKIFAILAHDLKNPIASMSNLSENAKFLAQNNKFDLLDKMTAQTETKLNALNDNLDNILLWAYSESDLLELQPKDVNLTEEVNKICELYSSGIQRKNITIINRLGDNDKAKIDLRVIQTIIRNLMANAIKFSFENSEIEVKTHRQDNTLELHIIDNGIGLPSDKPQDSEAYKSSRQKLKGSGIGLKMCHELAKRAHLMISIDSNPTGGVIGRVSGIKVA